MSMRVRSWSARLEQDLRDSFESFGDLFVTREIQPIP